MLALLVETRPNPYKEVTSCNYMICIHVFTGFSRHEQRISISFNIPPGFCISFLHVPFSWQHERAEQDAHTLNWINLPNLAPLYWHNCLYIQNLMEPILSLASYNIENRSLLNLLCQETRVPISILQVQQVTLARPANPNHHKCARWCLNPSPS